MTPLETVSKHADGLDRLADAMQAAGVGMHPTKGHVALLRRMAGAMRADAANGRVPHEYNDRASMYATAVGPALPGTVIRTLNAAGLPTDKPISLDTFDAAMARTDLPIRERIGAKQALILAGRLA
jgi:hypothetical protein